MADVFVYTGNGGEIVPPDVRRVLVDPSVTSIPAEAFQRCKKLAEVVLCEGLVEANIQLLKSTFQTHLGGFVTAPLHALFKLLFISTMTLKT